MKTLYVHIGTPETDTPAIGRFCEANREGLKCAGYLFIEPFHICRDMDAGLEKLRDAFRESDRVILSDEEIWTEAFRDRSDFWERISGEGREEGFQVKAVVYLRRQDEYLISRWNRMIADDGERMTVPWEEYRSHFPEDLRPDYDRALDEIASVIGQENMIVRRFERVRFFGGMLETDFLHAVGADMVSGCVFPETRHDLGFAGNICEIRRILNTLPDEEASGEEFFRESLEEYAEISALACPAGALSPEESSEFMEPYLEGNRRIARKYFGEDSLLFDMSFPNTAKWERDDPCLLDDVIRLMGAADRRVFGRLNEQKREIEEVTDYTADLMARLGKLERRRGIFRPSMFKPKKVTRSAKKATKAFFEALKAELS